MKKILLFAVTLSSIVILTFTSFLIGEQNGKKKAKVTFSPVAQASSKEPNEYHEISQTDAVVFLGDSITSGNRWEEDFNSDLVINMGISANKIEDVINRIPGVAGYHPKEVYLLIGINNLTVNQNLDLFETLYRQLIKTMTKEMPKTKIVVQSIFPINTDLYTESKLTNDIILEANKIIQEIAGEYHAEYFNIQYFFKDKEGSLAKNVTRDGLHLSEAGYQIWLSQLKKRDSLATFFDTQE